MKRKKSELNCRDRYEVAEGIPCDPIKKSDRWLGLLFIVLICAVPVGTYLLIK